VKPRVGEARVVTIVLRKRPRTHAALRPGSPFRQRCAESRPHVRVWGGSCRAQNRKIGGGPAASAHHAGEPGGGGALEDPTRPTFGGPTGNRCQLPTPTYLTPGKKRHRTTKQRLVPYPDPTCFPSRLVCLFCISCEARDHSLSSLAQHRIALGICQPRLNPRSCPSDVLTPRSKLHSTTATATTTTSSLVHSSHVLPWGRRVLNGGQPAQPVYETRPGRQELAA
jgi:hypothetical protein